MDEAFDLLEPQDAQEFLKQFPAVTRKKGEACFRSGRVQNLTPEEPGRAYSAQVQDQQGEQQVNLYFDEEVGWDGDCTCELEVGCEHVFAAMSALLAEHRAAVVRGLSAGVRRAAEAVAGEGGKPIPQTPAVLDQDLATRLAEAKGSALTKEESRFVRGVREVYLRCRATRQITFWDFQQMGLPMFGYGWGNMQIWPTLPKSDYEFWLYVANAALEQKVKLPGFMDRITDLGLIAEPLARWRRSKEVEKWKQTLGRLQLEAPLPPPTPQGETDLRLMVEQDEAHLQWRRPGEAEFESLKQTAMNQLAADSGGFQFTSQAEVLWGIYSRVLAYGVRAKLHYYDPQQLVVLNRLLRTRALEERIVDNAGHPLARPAEPLRWELLPAANEEDDYRLRLVQANGEPAPEFVAVLDGSPPLYLTPHAIFTGPRAPEQVLEPEGETRIPAPALERTAGVAFLQTLGVELPPRLRQRVRQMPYQVAISCKLRPPQPLNQSEECEVSVVAEAPDGHQQVWTGFSWAESNKGARKRGERDEILVYDAAVLAAVPPLLEPLNLKANSWSRGLTTRVTKKFPATFAAWLKTVPPQITVQLEGELASLANAEVSGNVKLEVTEAEIDWFDLRVVLNVADATLTAEEIKLLLAAKGNFVRLKGKGWRRLEYNLSEEEDERLARLGLSTREFSAEPQRLHALQLADEAAKKFLPEEQVAQIQRRASELKTRVAPDLPAGVKADLRPYQLEGFHFLAYLSANRFGGILADDMGLGKTLQTLAWLLWLREQATVAAGVSPAVEPGVPPGGNGAGTSAVRDPSSAGPGGETPAATPPSLVVCPKSVMDNWQAEAAKFTPSLRVKVWTAAELDDFSEQLKSADLHVLNYSQLRAVSDKLKNARWQAVILDEGQYIKNPNSQTAHAARSLRAEHRLILSGTPIENRLLDLWSLMAYAMPGVLGNRAQFAKLYDAKGDPFARRRLASRVRPFVLRRTKAQVAKDLPDRIEEDLFCEIEGEQKALYRAELKRAQQLLLGLKTQKEVAQFQFNFLASLLRLRQICCDPRLMKPDVTGPSAKVEALLEQLEPLMEEDQKVLVFSQFVEMLELLRPALAERNWPTFYLAGHTENRGELVRNFQSSKGPAVFLISLKAGGFGLNLTAASYVVLFDPWWNPAVENQAIDRTHRIGQSNKVIAYRLLIKNSIEEKIRALQKQKKALAEDVLGEEKFAQSLTLQDLQFLFAD